jgi:hypothetical protein
MFTRRTRFALSVVASVVGAAAGVVAGGTLYERRQLERLDHLGVTLYSEANYRGARVTLRCADDQRNVRSLSETGLPRIGSIKIERFMFRPALLQVPLAWRRGALLALIDKDREGAADQLQTATAHVVGMLHPPGWRLERALAEDMGSWVRLWADQPRYPLPPRTPDQQTWRDIRTDTSSLGPWRTRVLYLEFGIGKPPTKAPEA